MTQVPGEIRPAVAGDLDGILRADQFAARGDRERAEVLRRRLQLGECQVHVANDAVTGFVIVKPVYFFGRDFIELLMVEPAARRSGIGRTLLRAALATAGTAQVFTSSNTSNHPMRSLLRAEDWSFSGELDGLDGGDPEMVFYKARPARSERTQPTAGQGMAVRQCRAVGPRAGVDGHVPGHTTG